MKKNLTESYEEKISIRLERRGFPSSSNIYEQADLSTSTSLLLQDIMVLQRPMIESAKDFIGQECIGMSFDMWIIAGNAEEKNPFLKDRLGA